MTTDADKIRFLAELAGWAYEHKRFHPWHHAAHGYRDFAPDYPHSLDAIARDLLPILRERDLRLVLYMGNWPGDPRAVIEDGRGDLWAAIPADTPARAAFEAIFEALHGGEGHWLKSTGGSLTT